MKTRVTELLGIEYPILLASMAWVTNADMVAAISDAGGLGTLGPNAGSTSVTKDTEVTAERLRDQIRQVNKMTAKPFAVNVVVGVEGLDKCFSDRCLDVVIEEKVPVVIVSQGSPNVYTSRLKKAGIKVIHVCSTVRHARKAQEAGVDAVVASGTEGGGHSGFDQNTTFCLVPQVVDAVDLPVIAGGGVTDGRQFYAALALGAEGVYMGTRFIATQECPAHPNFKRAIVQSRDGDTVAIRHGSLGQKGTGNEEFVAERRGSLRLIINQKIRDLSVKNRGLINYDTLAQLYEPTQPLQGGSITVASFLHGDMENAGFFAAGQGSGLVDQIDSCGEVIRSLVKGARDTQRRINPV